MQLLLQYNLEISKYSTKVSYDQVLKDYVTNN